MKISGSIFSLKGDGGEEYRIFLACFPEKDARYYIKVEKGTPADSDWIQVVDRIRGVPFSMHLPTLARILKEDPKKVLQWHQKGKLCEHLEIGARRSASEQLPAQFIPSDVKRVLTSSTMPAEWRLKGIFCKREPNGRVVLINDRSNSCWDLYQRCPLKNWRGKVDGKTVQILENGRKFIHLKDRWNTYRTGAWKVCKFALDTLKKCKIARLVVKYDKDPKKIRFLMERGLRIHEALKDLPGIVKQYGFVDTQNRWGEREFVCYQRYYRLGDLHQFLYRKPNLAQCETIARDLLTTLTQMHERHIYHRDLKEENILLDYRADDPRAIEAAICDLDLSWIEGEEKNEYCGTRHAFAPERAAFYVHGGEPLTEGDLEKNDVWGMGLVLYSLYHGGKLPDLIPRGNPKERIVPKLAELAKRTDPLYPEPEDPMQHLIWKMLQIDPKNRISMKEALSEFQRIHTL